MALNKLRQLDQHTAGVTIPKDDLLLEGLLDEDGQIRDEQYLHIRHEGDGQWTVELVEGIEM